MGKSVGFDTHIYVLGSNVKEYEEIINDPDLKVEITPITNEKIEEISNGEITRAESFNYRTFERENGGLWDKRIFGRSEEEMRQFMGHLNLPITYLNPLFPQVVLNKLLIYPVRYRWVKTSKSGFIVANWSQDTYVRIIKCKKRLENLVKLNSQKIIIENEERRLRENIEGYYTKGVDKYSGLFADYFKRIRDFFTAMPIDYCANMREVADMLKQKRKEAHLTQKEVAKMVGINLTTYGQIERGKVPFLNKGATIFMKICEVLDILPYAMFKSLISKIENKNLS